MKVEQNLEAASTLKSAHTHACRVFVTRDFDLWPFDRKINGFPGLIAEHFSVKFGEDLADWILWCAAKTDTRISSGTRVTLPSVQTVSDVCLKRTGLFDTSAVSVLEVPDDNIIALNKFTYLLTQR